MNIDPRSGLAEEQVETLQQRLEETREAILERARRWRPLGDDAPLLSETRGDAADQAEIGFEQGMQVELTERDRHLLREIEAALGRIVEGTYGVSELSGEPVGFERLLVQPWARRSQADEERLEEEARSGTPPSL
jgi:DnaK suppressor protein